MIEDILNVAVVGAGYWGKNLVHNFATAKRCNLKYVCDVDEKPLATKESEANVLVELAKKKES